MIFAIELSDDLDPTALATLLLAVVTIVAVVIGWRTLRQTKDEVGLSRWEVEQSHRPVVVPLIDETREMKPWPGPPTTTKPVFGKGGRLIVPIKNIGSGPALDVQASLIARNAAGEHSKAHAGAVAGLGVSDVAPIEFCIPDPSGVSSFVLSVKYLDVARKHRETSATYRFSDKRYCELDIPDERAPARRSGQRRARWRARRGTKPPIA